MFKRILITGLLFCVPFLLAGIYDPMDTFDTHIIRTNAGDYSWIITGTGDDTSEAFDMPPWSSIQYCFNDTSATWDDSVNYKIQLLTSLKGSPDSSFVLAQTITSGTITGGYQAVKAINVPVAMKGKLVVTGLTGNTILPGLYGIIIVGGWSNQPTTK